MSLAVRRQRGTSLVELAVSLALGTLMLTLMAGSVLALALSEQNATAASGLVASIETARAEAVIRRTPVGVCGIAAGDSDAPAEHLRCTDGAWTGGWMTFVDENGNRRVDEGESVLQVQRTRRVHVQLSETPASTPSVGFSPTGMLANPISLRLAVHAAQTSDPNARAVCVAIDGHVELASMQAACR